MSGKSQTLDKMRRDNQVAVVQINGGWGIQQRLNQLGIHPGDRIEVKRNGILGGPVLMPSRRLLPVPVW